MELTGKKTEDFILFSKFKMDVLGIKTERKKPYDEYFDEHNIKLLGITSILVFVTCLFWVIVNSTGVAGLKLFTHVSLIATIILIVFSTYICLLFLFRKHAPHTLVRFSLLAYCLYLIITSTLLQISRDIHLEEANAALTTDLSLSSLYLFIFTLVSFPKKTDTIISFIVIIACLFAPLFAPGASHYSFVSHLLFTIYVICAYIFNLRIFKSLYANADKNDKLNSQLIVEVNKDKLTGVFNRAALDKYYNYLKDKKDVHSVGVVIFDIDEFDSYNNEYTHQEGDKVLIAVSKLAFKEGGKEGMYLFRYGGDKFIYILPNYTDEQILEFSKKINKTIYAANIERKDKGASFDRITISLGCFSMDKQQMIRKDYLTDANNQIAKCKKGKKNCIAFEDTIYRAD